MAGRHSVWPALTIGVIGIGLLVAGVMLPWLDGRDGTTLPWRSVLPYDLAGDQAQSYLTSIALPLVGLAGFALLAILVRVRWLALALAFATLGVEIAWFASEAFRRARGDLLASQLETGAWLALGGAVLMIVAAFLTPHWEPEVR